MSSLKWPLVFAAVPILAAFTFLLPGRPLHDEAIHFNQARTFALHNWEVRRDLTVWPTTHLLLSGVLSIAGVDRVKAARAAITCCALFAAIAFYGIAAHLDSRTAVMKTAQFWLLPIVVPYCAMVYTDIPALASLLWMLWAILKRRPAAFCLAALSAAALRQNNIVWLVAGWAAYLYEAHEGESRKALRAVTVCCGLILAAWGLCIWSLGGIAVGDMSQRVHVLAPRGLPNVEFAIGIGGVLFFPLFLELFERLGSIAKNGRWLMAVIAVGVFVALTFSVEHRSNTLPQLVAPYLRNRMLYQITHSEILRWLFAGFVAISAMGFARFPFAPAVRHLRFPLYVVAALSLLPFELIEQRYYLPFFAFFTAMREPSSDRTEWIQLATTLGMTAVVSYAILRLGLFI
jgi:hypothetical protein